MKPEIVSFNIKVGNHMNKFKKGDIVKTKASVRMDMLVTVVNADGMFENTFQGKVIEGNAMYPKDEIIHNFHYDAFEMHQELKTAEADGILKTGIETGAKNVDLRQRPTNTEMDLRKWCIDRAIHVQSERIGMVADIITKGYKIPSVDYGTIREEAQRFYEYIMEGKVK